MQLDAEHRMMLDGIRHSIREITDELIDWADNAYNDHGCDAVNPDPIALAVHLKILTDLARDATQARDHLAQLMAADVRANPATFAEPIEGIGLIKVGNDYRRDEWDNEALASKLAAALSTEEPRRAVELALRCAGSGWRVTGLRALGVDVDRYRTTTTHTPKARIE